MEVQIEGRHTDVATTTQEWIGQQLEALNAHHDDIIHARVTLVKNERHQKGHDEARVFLTLAGHTLSASRTGDTLDEALYKVMDVTVHELRDFRVARQQVQKTPGPRPRGRILRLFPERDYGFIETESHQEVYFHANSVHGIPFEKLAVGMTVDLDIESGDKGPQATRVTPH
jgi:cold shock CspA family protein/ribosome-associated translation inhibitor RaiA